MATFAYLPDWGAKKDNKPRTNKIQFGDGYEQRSTDGLNTNMETWSIAFKRPPATIDIIDLFLSDRKGVEAFNWTTPKGRASVFKCEEWNISYDDIGWGTLSATFVEVPEKVSA